MDSKLLRVACLVVYLDRLPAEVSTPYRIKIAYLVSHEIERAIEKRGLTEVEAIVQAVSRRVEPFVRADLEMDREQQAQAQAQVNN